MHSEDTMPRTVHPAPHPIAANVSIAVGDEEIDPRKINETTYELFELASRCSNDLGVFGIILFFH
jgi:hypothetical protein